MSNCVFVYVCPVCQYEQPTPDFVPGALVVCPVCEAHFTSQAVVVEPKYRGPWRNIVDIKCKEEKG